MTTLLIFHYSNRKQINSPEPQFVCIAKRTRCGLFKFTTTTLFEIYRTEIMCILTMGQNMELFKSVYHLISPQPHCFHVKLYEIYRTEDVELFKSNK